MSENKKFWDTKNGKILSHTIHEHNSGLGIIANYKSVITTLLKTKLITFVDSDTEETFMKSIIGIEEGRVRCREAVDYCYTKFKEQEDE